MAVRDSLENTIDGKLMLLEQYNEPTVGQYHQLVRYAMQEMLKQNIQELRAILGDVDRCLPDEFSNIRGPNFHE
jgi:hypothetical protein